MLIINSSYSQEVFNNCVRIDFENFNSSGQTISDQYLENAGIRFQLENGSFPVLAQPGAPTEAFTSGFGPDNIDDPALIGDYILTDDGLLDGVDYSPLLVFFDNPVDSVSGLILDIDADEEFEILALDENGVVLMSQLIESGDSLTGDAIATPWGFNLAGCEGRIHSIKLDGSRTSGDFGLGMDNFVFCFSGTDLIQDLEVNVTNILCQDNPGEIQILFDDQANLTFSIDGGISSNTTGVFENLTIGEYEIIVTDENGCQGVLNTEVLAEGPTIIEEVIITHTSCGLNNGSFQIIATQDQGVIYFLNTDAFNPQSQNTFENVEPGVYTATVIGPTGCSAAQVITINPSDDLFIEDSDLIDDACQKMIGSIEVNTNGGTGALTYSLNENEFQESPFFDSLSMGEYVVEIQDEAFCTRYDTVQINDTPGIIISNIQTTETLCEIANGTVSFAASGGTGQLTYRLDNETISSQPFFAFVDVGEHIISVFDELGCSLDSLARIDIPICPIFIPNIFSPAIEDENKEFKIYTNQEQNVNILRYQIYDRWGARIYNASNFGVYDNGFWWNGNDAGYKYSSGVYAYIIEVEYFDGSRETFYGDITLAR